MNFQCRFLSCPSEMDGYCFPRAHHQNCCKPCTGSLRIVLVKMWKASWLFGPGSVWALASGALGAPGFVSLSPGLFLCPPGTQTPLGSGLCWKQHFLWNSPSPPAFDFRSCELWFQELCFLLLPLSVAQSWIFSLDLPVHLRPALPGAEDSALVDFSVFFNSLLCAFVSVTLSRISLCSFDQQIQRLQRNHPGICAFPHLW